MFNAQAFIKRQEEVDTLWGAAQVAALPKRFVAGLLKQREKLNQRGDYAGNVYIRSLGQSFKYPASLASSNDELIAQAETRANECAKISTVAGMAAICARFGVELPQARFRADGAACYVAGVMARLKCPLWWRRALRKTMGREIERIAIDLGFVHRRAGCYASDETVSRRKQQKARNRALLESIKAVNENGQEYTLAELSALGVSNPAIRRGELMTRIAGFENIALNLGHIGVFYTVTAPSRFHARHSKSGQENDKYSRETPRQAQAYLCQVWARQRAALNREGIKLYGFRVAEAHHDGTPHWHILVFVAPDLEARSTAIMEKYAIAEDRAELGKDITPRFKVEIIDQKRGTAAGYIAKYISKNIDGYGLEDDKQGTFDGVGAVSGAERVDAWASAWGIRQFQQIGGAPVSVWRELRRLGSPVGDGVLDRAARAADLGDWAGFLMVMGGASPRRFSVRAGYLRAGALLDKLEAPGADLLGVMDGKRINSRMKKSVNAKREETRIKWEFEAEKMRRDLIAARRVKLARKLAGEESDILAGEAVPHLWGLWSDAPGRYDAIGREIVQGVAAGEQVEKTRVHVWEIKRGGKNAVDVHGVGFVGDSRAVVGVGAVLGSGSAGCVGGRCEVLGLVGFEVGPILAPWSPVNNCTGFLMGKELDAWKERTDLFPGALEARERYENVHGEVKGEFGRASVSVGKDAKSVNDAKGNVGREIPMRNGAGGGRNSHGNRQIEKSGLAEERWE